MEMALAALAMMLLLNVIVFHISLNWHKNCNHWHVHASAVHWHCQAVERRIVHELMVQPSLRGNVMSVVLCYCFCFGQAAVEVEMTMGSATMADQRVLWSLLDLYDMVATAVNWLNACLPLCLTVGCSQGWFSMALLPWQHGLAQSELGEYLCHRVVDCCRYSDYGYGHCCYCCCCVRVLCFGYLWHIPPNNPPDK